jgi:hypothetical protein
MNHVDLGQRFNHASVPLSSNLYTYSAMRVSISDKGVLDGITLLDSSTKTPKCHRFSRVPYACPPTGPRRWRKPQPLPPKFSYSTGNSSGDYRKPSSICPQPRTFGRQSKIHDEDCLQSNIWVPLGKTPPDGWPVFFYIRKFFLPRRLYLLTDSCRWRFLAIWFKQLR